MTTQTQRQNNAAVQGLLAGATPVEQQAINDYIAGVRNPLLERSDEYSAMLLAAQRAALQPAA